MYLGDGSDDMLKRAITVAATARSLASSASATSCATRVEGVAAHAASASASSSLAKAAAIAKRRDERCAAREARGAAASEFALGRFAQERVMTELRIGFAREARREAAEAAAAAAQAADAASAACLAAVLRVETAKANRIASDVAAHECSLSAMRAHFAEVTHKNLVLVQRLKEELDDARLHAATQEQGMKAMAAANERMRAPFVRALAEHRSLAVEAAASEAQREECAALRTRARKVACEVEAARWELSLVRARSDSRARDVAALRNALSIAAQEAAQRGGLLERLLQMRLHEAAAAAGGAVGAAAVLRDADSANAGASAPAPVEH